MRIQQELDLKRGATAADIGSGSGSVAVGVAQAIGPDGRVLASEIDAQKRQATAARAKAAGLRNVSTVVATASQTGLPPECCHGIVLRHVYHHLTEPDAIMHQISAALRPGGRLLVIDFSPSVWLSASTPDNLPADRTGHGIDQATVVREVVATGLRHIKTVESWPGPWLLNTFALVFERPLADSGRHPEDPR